MTTRRKTARTTKIAALAAVAALGLAACGDDGNEAESAPTVSPADTPAEVGTIVDVAAASGSFTTLVAAVEAAGLVETLSGPGPFTVFAPTDDAFAAALDTLGLTAEELLADTETLTSILTYHVIADEVNAATAISLDGQNVETVNGATVTISVVDGNVMINGATVVTPDVAASNGIIHAIDAVLLPPQGDDMSADDAMSEDTMSDEMSDTMSDEMSDEMSEETATGSIVDVAVNAGSFTTLVAAVEAAGLADMLTNDGPFTVLAPTDEAFAAALDALGLTAEELLADTDTLTAILSYHVLAGEVPSETVVSLDGQSAVTLNGASIDITVDGDTVMVNDATVTAVDIQAANGIIHVIDTVLLPPAS